MERNWLPLHEDDLSARGVIEPSEVVQPINVPPCAVVCFFREVVESVAADGRTVELARLVAAHGEHPVYAVERGGQKIGVFHPGVGAPLAAAFLEEAIALGFRSFVAVGGAGALLPDLVLGHAVVVRSAVRDEGTSFHYMPPSRVVDADPAGVAVLEATLQDARVPHVVGRSWTTDAVYRETRGRVQRRVEEGCITVDMEAAAFFAVARYRNVRFAQLLYAGDSLAGPEWDDRGWATADVRRELFWHAADACVRLHAVDRTYDSSCKER